MDSEDEMVVVIVGDNNDIKEETIEENDNFKVEELMETAVKYGEYVDYSNIDIKVERVSEEEYLDDEEYPGSESNLSLDYNNMKIEYGNEYYEERQSDSDGGKRRKQIFIRSFVENLRIENPELRHNREKLINYLVKVMRNLKRPPPPPGYCFMNETMYECVRCGTQCPTEPAIWRHYQEKHGRRYLVCYACGVDFRSTTNLYKHEKKCIAIDAAIVLQARARFLGPKGRSRPFLSPVVKTKKKKPVSKKVFTCLECSARFNSRSNLRSHEYLHRGERPFRCQMCPYAYTSYSAMMRHVKKHTDAKYICDHCNRVFNLKTALAQHMDTHLPQPKFGCDRCEKRFVQKAALKLHIDRVHLNLPPPCACQICPKRYPRMSILKEHMKREHGMTLMTRKMFFKAFPKLTDTQLEQAMVIMNTDMVITDKDFGL